MKIWECRLELEPGGAEAFAAWAGPEWIVWEDRATRRTVAVGYLPSRGAAESAGRRLIDHRAPGLRNRRPRLRPMPDADWRESYKAHFRRWRLGKLHLVPVWERAADATPTGHRVVWLDPGMAFGTGNHATTRLCCRRLVAYAAKTPGPGVVDAGCGSGILAISAAKLGLGPVWAFDVDPEAVRISRKNAALNGVGGAVAFRVNDLKRGLGRRQAGLVLANIQADVLRRHAGALLRAVAPGGWLVLSGILAAELRPTRAAFSRLAPGWAVDSRRLGEWADLVFRRPIRAQNRSDGVRLRNSSR